MTSLNSDSAISFPALGTLCRVLLCGVTTLSTAIVHANDLVPLRYNHPGLVVDLGVGLWAWPLPMDYDGDGDYDLVVSCPDKPSNGTYFFENPDGSAFPVFKPGVRIGPGHRNIRVSHVDGEPRVLTPGIEYRDFRRKQFGAPNRLAIPGDYFAHARKLRARQWHVVDFDGNGKQDLVIGIGDWKDYGWDDAWTSRGAWKKGPLRGSVFVFSDLGLLRNRLVPDARPTRVSTTNRPVEVYGWPSPNLADFDGDGDLDLLCGEFLDRFTYFENTGTRTQPAYEPRGFLKDGDGLLRMDLQMIVPSAIDWDRDGDVDLICGDEDGRVAFIEHTGQVKDGAPVFRTPRYFRQTAEHLKCGALATPYCIDWDADGDEDILSGNTAGYVEFFENLGIPDGSREPRWAAPVRLTAGGKVIRIQAGPNGSIQGPAEAKWGYTTFTVADWDHDGRLDIVLNSIWGKVLWYRNSGTTTLPRLEPAQPVEVEWTGATPKPAWTWWKPEGKQLVTQWRTTPVVVDWTGDGLNDLVMLDHEGYLALFERTRSENSVLQLKPGQRAFVDVRGELVRLNPGRAGKSGRRKLHAVDWDGDGDLDLLMNGVNADLYENRTTFEGRTMLLNRGPLSERRLAGHTSSPATANFWNAELRDLLVGAEDGFLYLQRRAASE
jgi:hypothetical protein